MNTSLGMAEIRELSVDELDLVTGGEKNSGTATVKVGNLVKIEAGNGALLLAVNGVGNVTIDFSEGVISGILGKTGFSTPQ